MGRERITTLIAKCLVCNGALHFSPFSFFFFFFFSYTLGFYRDHQWPLDRGDGGKVLDTRGGIQGELKNGAKVVFDPDLGNVVSLEASEGWLLMGDFKGIYFLSHPIT